jgi:hypothetical protein
LQDVELDVEILGRGALGVLGGPPGLGPVGVVVGPVVELYLEVGGGACLALLIGDATGARPARELTALAHSLMGFLEAYQMWAGRGVTGAGYGQATPAMLAS